MRVLTIPVLLLALAITACSTRGTVPPSKHISQDGALRVHPDLVGQPAPAGQRSAAPATQAPAGDGQAAPGN